MLFETVIICPNCGYMWTEYIKTSKDEDLIEAFELCLTCQLEAAILASQVSQESKLN